MQRKERRLRYIRIFLMFMLRGLLFRKNLCHRWVMLYTQLVHRRLVLLSYLSCLILNSMSALKFCYHAIFCSKSSDYIFTSVLPSIVKILKLGTGTFFYVSMEARSFQQSNPFYLQNGQDASADNTHDIACCPRGNCISTVVK